MQKEPYKVSVLTPIYGVEKYIERCAISLFEQTYQNVEYIFVNDCTADNSIQLLLQVLSKYPEKKSCFKLINHEVNMGLAAARNTAVENASGEFLVHVDSDDWIETTLIEKCVEEQQRTNADIVSADYLAFNNNGTAVFEDTSIRSPRGILEGIFKGAKISTRIWGRLIRTCIYQDNNIKLINGADFAEDSTAYIQILYFAKYHGHINIPLYNYECRTTTSYTKKFNYKNSIQSLQNYDLIRSFFEKHAPEYDDAMIMMELEIVSGHMIMLSKSPNNKDYYDSVLLKRLATIDKKYWKRLSIKKRTALYLHYFIFVSVYVKVGGFFNKMMRCF